MRGKLKWLFSQQFFRFLLSGGINAAFSYALFAGLMFFLKNKEIAITLNMLIAIFFNYNISARFVFREKMKLKQIVKFYAVYFVTYPINLIHLYVTVDIWSWNVYFSQFSTLLYIPIISFLLQKIFVFRNTIR